MTKVSAGDEVELHVADRPLAADDLAASPVGLANGAQVSVVTEVSAVGELLAEASKIYVWQDDSPRLHLASMTGMVEQIGLLWTAAQCADHLGVAVRTWHAYVSRPGTRNPAPAPIANAGAAKLWDPAQVRAYSARRRPRKLFDNG